MSVASSAADFHWKISNHNFCVINQPFRMSGITHFCTSDVCYMERLKGKSMELIEHQSVLFTVPRQMNPYSAHASAAYDNSFTCESEHFNASANAIGSPSSRCTCLSRRDPLYIRTHQRAKQLQCMQSSQSSGRTAVLILRTIGKCEPYQHLNACQMSTTPLTKQHCDILVLILWCLSNKVQDTILNYEKFKILIIIYFIYINVSIFN